MKSKDEAKIRAQRLLVDANSLPEQNLFGDDNTESIQELRDWAEALEIYAQTGNLPEDEEVANWITGKTWSSLNDYDGLD